MRASSSAHASKSSGISSPAPWSSARCSSISLRPNLVCHRLPHHRRRRDARGRARSPSQDPTRSSSSRGARDRPRSRSDPCSSAAGTRRSSEHSGRASATAPRAALACAVDVSPHRWQSPGGGDLDGYAPRCSSHGSTASERGGHMGLSLNPAEDEARLAPPDPARAGARREQPLLQGAAGHVEQRVRERCARRPHRERVVEPEPVRAPAVPRHLPAGKGRTDHAGQPPRAESAPQVDRERWDTSRRAEARA